ncbi:MAG: Verru_Chthon cassette protein B [Chthoniobacter sp.]|nr:Verru_Chthon cassette protein B [Chthoniobacter sp.]
MPRKFIARRRQSGFSLVEVVLAVGVIAFAFVAIMGLLPAGLQQFRQAIDNSVCTQIAQRIIQDAQLTDYATLVDATHLPANTAGYYMQANSYCATDVSKSNPIHVRYFDESGNEIIPQGSVPSSTELASIIYHVNTRIAPATYLPGTDSSLGTSNGSLATVLVQVAFNPSGRIIPITADKKFDLTNLKTMPVRNYCAQVGRND